MPASPKPVRSSPEAHKRAQRIFARLMAGESMRAIAAAETLSLRRVQQIVRDELDRRDANPADDFALLQIARLERALDLIGAPIDAGKPSATHAFVRILDHLNRLAPDRLKLKAAFQRIGGEVDTMEDRLGRLDAAREALASRQAESGERESQKTLRKGGGKRLKSLARVSVCAGEPDLGSGDRQRTEIWRRNRLKRLDSDSQMAPPFRASMMSEG
jgi:hypothetical protein